MVRFLQGPCPRVISKPHEFFFLRHLLLSEAKILRMKCQLNSKTGTMKILATEHMWCYANQHSFCLRVYHILYMSRSRLQASRADTNAQELTELTAAEPWLLFLRSRPFSVGEQHSLAFTSPFPEYLIGRWKVYQLEPFQICPSLSPNTPPIGKHHLFVLFFLRLRHPKIFNGIVNLKFSKKLPNIPSAHPWNPIRPCPQCPLSNRMLLFFLPDTRTK